MLSRGFYLPRRRALLSTTSLGLATLVVLALWLYRHEGVTSIADIRQAAGNSRFGQLIPVGGASEGEQHQLPDPSSPPTTPEQPPSTMPDNGPPTVRLRQGTYSGLVLQRQSGGGLARDIEAWRGIPYAQSTAGENRFRPPVPLPPAGENARTIEALRFGQRCPPGDGRAAVPGTYAAGVPSGEDCLNANVYRWARGAIEAWERTEKARRAMGRQRRKAGKGVPVVVYVHGGAFNTGTGVERNMASFIAWADEPMIGINFNYRVGALGFLPSSLTAREGLLNLGLRDQQMLFEWVRDNVAAFGGDPDNVTIMGLSAGAHSIGHHLMYYNASTAPFKRAILESGAATARAVFAASHPRHEVQFREFLVACGLGAVPEADIFPRLRKLPLETVVAASVSVWKKYEAAVCWPFQPASDPSDGIMPRKPVESWRQGFGMRGIPVLTGFNVNEGTVFIPPRADSNAQFRNFFSTLIPSLTSADLDELDAFYPDPVSHRDSSPFAKPPPPRGFGRQWRRLDAAYAHFAYICPVLQTAHFLSNSSSSSQPAPVYVYRYAATSGDWNTANHVDEAPIVTHDLDLLPDRARDMPGTRRLVRAMHGYWARFAATGDPNPPEGHPSTDPGDDADVAPLPVWPKFVSPFAADESRKSNAGGSDSLGQVMVFGEGNDERWAVTRNRRGNEGTTAQAKPLAEEDLKQCEFWWKRVDLSEGLGRQEGGARL